MVTINDQFDQFFLPFGICNTFKTSTLFFDKYLLHNKSTPLVILDRVKFSNKCKEKKNLEKKNVPLIFFSYFM